MARIAGLLLGRRIVDHQLEHEAVELGLGQVVRPFRLDRVLRGQHQERPLELVARAVDRHAVLLHDLQQRGVGLGRRAVDLVGQQQLREDRPGPEAELLRLHVEDRRPGDVGGHQVGGELDAAELAAQHAAQRPHEERLAQAGHALDQHVAVGEQGHQRAQHQFVLADEDLADLGGDAVEEFLGTSRAVRHRLPSVSDRFVDSCSQCSFSRWRRPRSRERSSMSATACDVPAEVGGARPLRRPRRAEDRPARETEDDADHGQVQEDPVGRPDVKISRPVAMLVRRILVADRRPAGAAFQEDHVAARRADLVDQLARQLAVLVVHQRQVQQERAVGDDDQLAFAVAVADVEPRGDEHVAVRLQQHVGPRVGHHAAVQLDLHLRGVDAFEPLPVARQRSHLARPVLAVEPEPVAIVGAAAPAPVGQKALRAASSRRFTSAAWSSGASGSIFAQ